MSVETVGYQPTYEIAFSAEDREWVATTSEFPSLSWLAPTPNEALRGLAALVDDVRSDLSAEERSVGRGLASC